MVLAEKGRIVLDDTPEVWLRNALMIFELQEAPLNHDIAILSRNIVLPHQDPADRFIAATAIYYGLTLATVDQKLVAADQVPVIC